MGNKIVLGISLGDYNGIGPEVILKALSHAHVLQWCTPLIYGSFRVLQFYKKSLDLREVHLQQIPDAKQVQLGKINLINCWDDQATEVAPGTVTEDAGTAARLCLEKAADDLDKGSIAALVTAPINKHNIQSEAFPFPGHTEFLTQRFEVKESLMLLVGEGLRMGLATGHIPLQQVSAQLSKEGLQEKLRLFLQSLKEDFGIPKPKLAVLGLNPHAGDEGLLGTEEQALIRPVVEEFQAKGDLIFGPFSADGFFGNAQFKSYDGVLGMYHDQGLIPFKYMHFESGVNYTAGLPVIRTSPDHGTAYDIAGKNQADPSSFLQAMYLALDLIKTRMNA